MLGSLIDNDSLDVEDDDGLAAGMMGEKKRSRIVLDAAPSPFLSAKL